MWCNFLLNIGTILSIIAFIIKISFLSLYLNLTQNMGNIIIIYGVLIKQQWESKWRSYLGFWLRVGMGMRFMGHTKNKDWLLGLWFGGGGGEGGCVGINTPFLPKTKISPLFFLFSQNTLFVKKINWKKKIPNLATDLVSLT